MYVRELPDQTVGDLIKLHSRPYITETYRTDEINIDLLDRQPTLKFPGHEIPVIGDTFDLVGAWLDVPSAFLERIPTGLANTVLNTLFNEKTDEVTLSFDDERGLIDAYAPEVRRVPKLAVIEVAANVMGAEAKVAEWRDETKGYSFDVYMPVAESDNVAVGDVTVGGLTFTCATKQNLLPKVNEWLFRLTCTNGAIIKNENPALQPRRKDSVEKIIEDFERLARYEFVRTQDDIEAFYHLREQRVQHPERTLARLAGEHGLAPPILRDILEGLPEYLNESGEATMFDLVNAITNQTNNPRLQTKYGIRRTLEVAGGAVITDESVRCAHCQNRLKV